jgi:hypothetical protein
MVRRRMPGYLHPEGQEGQNSHQILLSVWDLLVDLSFALHCPLS